MSEESLVARLREEASVCEIWLNPLDSGTDGHIALLREAADALGAAEKERAWLPIESAPKDGTPVDLWLSPPGISAGSGRSPDCWFSAGRWWMYDETDDEQCRCEVHNATHWRPLPLPPQSQSAEER